MEIDMIVDNRKDYEQKIRTGIRNFNKEKNQTGLETILDMNLLSM